MDLANADSQAYASVADSVRDTFGRLDGLVHNAGILGPRLSIERKPAHRHCAPSTRQRPNCTK